MDILIWIVVGIGAGLLAQYGLKDKWSGGMTGNLVVGALGAVTAGWFIRAIWAAGASGLSFWGLLAAFAGASALLWAGRAFTANKVLN
jgi:uncharacterized membrane protein YeaQ/YmgE (transglycosylase-associated protein family)